MKKSITAIMVLALLVGAGYAFAGTADPTITVTAFTPSGGKDQAAKIKASLDSLDVAVEAIIDIQDAVMVQKAAITAVAETMTNTFATVFATAPIVVVTYTEDPGDVRPAFVTLVTPSNFVCKVASSKDYGYIAVGTRP